MMIAMPEANATLSFYSNIQRDWGAIHRSAPPLRVTAVDCAQRRLCVCATPDTPERNATFHVSVMSEEPGWPLAVGTHCFVFRTLYEII
jgi:hypothetical protein